MAVLKPTRILSNTRIKFSRKRQLRYIINQLQAANQLTEIKKSGSNALEAKSSLDALEPNPGLFSKIWGFAFLLLGKLSSTRESFAHYLEITLQDVISP